MGGLRSKGEYMKLSNLDVFLTWDDLMTLFDRFVPEGLDITDISPINSAREHRRKTTNCGLIFPHLYLRKLIWMSASEKSSISVPTNGD